MLVLSFFTFTLVHISPSDPVTLKYSSLGITPNRELVEQEKEAMGLNDSLPVQYIRWLKKALRGDLGYSFKYRTSVWNELTSRIPNTLLLTGTTLLLTVFFAIPLGMISALCRNKWIDYFIRFVSFFGVSMPSFWVGALLMYGFGVKLHWFPIMGNDSWKHLVLPSSTLAFWMVSLYVRRIRGSALEELHKDYMTGGLARGLSKRKIIFTQILPNSLLSIITMFGMSIGSLLGGATIVESIFSWRGIGEMAVSAISVRDFPIIQGYVLWMAIIYVTVNLIVDLSYRFLDPRIRLRKEMNHNAVH